MNVAFYAPLKPPTHPTPSGDRVIARAFMAALERAGHRVSLASIFRSREADGDRARQARLERIGNRLALRLCRRFLSQPRERRPGTWFTYHLYHKAPDFLGPVVASALGIPYIVAEASHAPKQARGAWGDWHELTAATIAKADAVIALNSDDVACVKPLLPATTRLVRMPPFFDLDVFPDPDAGAREAFAAERGLDPGVPWLLSVAMMRRGRKAECYDLLARALEGLRDERWQLIVVGDGDASAEVRSRFEPLAERVRFLGLLSPTALPPIYAMSDLFVWPAIGEPLGLVFLEAQASGLAVIAGDARGVPDLVRHDVTGLVVPQGDEQAFRDAVRDLLHDPERRRLLGERGRRHVNEVHDLASAAATLRSLLGELRG